MEPTVEIDNAPHTYVSLSSTHGYGLFADKKFQAGEIIVNYNLYSEYWNETDYFSLDKETIDRGWFVMVGGTRCITTDKFSKFSYINHSRNPNCVWLIERRMICAGENIVKDVELFIDYRVEPLPPGAKIPSWY